MERDPEAADVRYFVVCNDEEQYSIWRTDKAVPAGWEVVGDADTKARCLARITELWIDVRPASLRRSLARREPGDGSLE
jgi:MbtH protein